ncbi:hypothetical protein, partial [Streptococcus pseudopneumoniae]|uniref:hypothetical protein n=1 Tax=Streptococcus pseudopneumoniae TaxID=257758 RepID=UPI001BB1BBD5
MPIVPRQIKPPPLAWLTNELDVDWPAGPFEQTFFELNSIASLYAGLPLDTVDLILRAESERRGEPVQVFGARIPIWAVRLWGPILILALQAYFLLHLVPFVNRPFPPESSFPSILFYGTKRSQQITLLSAAVL